MKKLLTNKKLMSTLSLILVAAIMIVNINLGGVRAKAETTPIFPGSSDLVGYGPNYDSTSTVENADKSVTISKNIKKVKDSQGEDTISDYEVTLNVTTTQDVDKAKDIAVAIVVDLSGSMEDTLQDGTTKYAAASEDIKALLDDLKEKTEGNCYVTLIGFGNHAVRLTNWLDINGTVEVTVEEPRSCGCSGVKYRKETKKAYDFDMYPVSWTHVMS